MDLPPDERLLDIQASFQVAHGVPAPGPRES